MTYIFIPLINIGQVSKSVATCDMMTGDNVRNIRKFRDKIALLNKNQAETNAQFSEVMQQVSEVKIKPQCSVKSEIEIYSNNYQNHGKLNR